MISLHDNEELLYHCPHCSDPQGIFEEVSGSIILSNSLTLYRNGHYYSDQNEIFEDPDCVVSFYCAGCGRVIMSGPHNQDTYARLKALLDQQNPSTNTSANQLESVMVL